MASRSSLAARTPERHVFGSLKNVHLLRLLGKIFRNFCCLFFDNTFLQGSKYIFPIYCTGLEMEWTEKHDLCLACEIRASDIFKSTKKKTVQRAQV